MPLIFNRLLENRIFQIFGIIVFFIPVICAHEKPKSITNPTRSDGFGAQYQTIIFSVIYAELNSLVFTYTPFNEMEHNYNNDPDFIEKKEDLINFLFNFELNFGDSREVSISEVICFFESNLEDCLASNGLETIKKLFRENKNPNDYFDDAYFNVAIHIRRLNPTDLSYSDAEMLPRISVSDELILSIIQLLREKYASRNVVFHIFSQGDEECFKELYSDNDIILHIDEPIESSFTSLVFADALVTSTSSFSYVAGILSEGEIYYMPFWHPPLPTWTNVYDLF